MAEAHVIIIRGAPGSGKSTTSKELAKYFPNGVRLEVDTVRNMVISVDWKNQQEHIDMLQVSAGMVVDFLRLGFSPVIVVDTFSGNKIVKFVEELIQFRNDPSIKVFGLFVSEQELERRLSLRSSDEFRDFSICKKLNDDLMHIKYEGEFQIDTSGISPEDTAIIICGALPSLLSKRTGKLPK